MKKLICIPHAAILYEDVLNFSVESLIRARFFAECGQRVLGGSGGMKTKQRVPNRSDSLRQRFEFPGWEGSFARAPSPGAESNGPAARA